MKKFAKEAEKGPVGHSCCDICAKVCRCLCTCGDECTCEELCNSGNLQSPIANTHARGGGGGGGGEGGEGGYPI